MVKLMQYPLVLRDVINDNDAEWMMRFIDDMAEKGILHLADQHDPNIPDSDKHTYGNVDADKVDPEYKEINRRLIANIREQLDLPKLWFHSSSLARMRNPHWMSVHTDIYNDTCAQSCLYAGIVYLNDDFEGGAITFPNEGFKYRPVAKSMVLYPLMIPYYDHGVERIISGTRYAMPVCITISSDVALKSLI